MWLLVLLSALPITADTDSSLIRQSELQAAYYLTNIHQEQSLDENLLAIAMLADEQTEIKSYIRQHITENGWQSKLLSTVKNFEGDLKNRLEQLVALTGSPVLLSGLLLEERDPGQRIKYREKFEEKSSPPRPASADINYKKLMEKIIQQEEITSDILPNDRFTLIHYLVLYSSSFELFSESYLSRLFENLNSNSKYAENELRFTFRQATVFRILYILNNYSEIGDLYNFLAEDVLFPNSPKKRILYRFLDFTLYRLGYFDRGLHIMREFTLPLSKQYSDLSTQYSTRLYQGIYLQNIGKIQEAANIYEAILTEAETNNIEVNYSAIYNNLGVAYWKLGKFNSYLELQFKALESTRQEKNYSYQLEIYRNLYIYHRRLNDSQSALHYLNEAQAIAQEYGNRNDLARINLSLGTFYRDFEKDFEKSDEYFTKTEKLVEPENNFVTYIRILFERAELWEQKGDLNQARQIYQRIAAISEDRNEYYSIDARINEAGLYLKLNDLDKADSLIAIIGTKDLDQLDFKEIIKAKTVEADYLNRTGNTEEALAIMEPVLKQVMERARSSADIQTGYWNVEPEFLNAFELVVSIFIKTGRSDRAVETLDQLKTINDAALYQSPLVRSRTLNETELARYKQITDQLDGLRKRLLTASEENRLDIQQTIEQLKVKKRQYDKRFSKEADREPVKLRTVQNRLSAQDLVLHITELKNTYYIAEINRSGISFRRIALNRSLRELFTEATLGIASHKTNLDILYSVTKLLRLDRLPSRYENITIIPDTYLYQLPVDALPVEEPQKTYSYGSTTYLIEKYNINYLTSLNDYRYRKDEDPANSPSYNWQYLGYGVSDFSSRSLVPLPYAGKEVQNIAQQLTRLPDSRTFVNEASSKQAFTSSAPQGRILHLATHSEISEHDPLFSTIYMDSNSSDSVSDEDFTGQIFAYELFELNLNNDMIMLNSCESGSGSYIQGTGIMGISRALRYAGANALVLNLWSVNDMMASDFAIHFYGELNKGKSKSEALRSTKQYFLRSKNASPHYWGPYMLIGDTNAIVEPNKKTNLLMAGTFMLYFLILAGLSLWVSRKRREN